MQRETNAAGRDVDSESIFKAVKGEVTTGFYGKTDFEAAQCLKKKTWQQFKREHIGVIIKPLFKKFC